MVRPLRITILTKPPRFTSLKFALLLVIVLTCVLFASHLILSLSHQHHQSTVVNVHEKLQWDVDSKDAFAPRGRRPKVKESKSSSIIDTQLEKTANKTFNRKLWEMRATYPLLKAAIEQLEKNQVKYEPLPSKLPEPDSVRQLENPEMTRFYGKIIDQAMKIKDDRLNEYLEDCNLLRSDRGHNGAFFSAIDRAKTPQCKKELGVVGCNIKKMSLYPTHMNFLPTYCRLDRDTRLTPLKLPREFGFSSEVFIVFLLQLAGRSERQVERLLRTIYSPNHGYLLHVDTDSEYMHTYLTQLTARFGGGNIHLMKARFQTLWGSSHLMLMQLAGYREAMEKWPQVDFVINLSESDVPIRPIKEMEQMLSVNKGMSFITGSHNIGRGKFMKRQGVNQTFYQCDGHMFRISTRRTPRGVDFGGGSDWFVMARNFIEYLVNTPADDKLMDPLSRFYSFSLLPSESFFSTLVKMSPWCNHVRNTDLKFAHWANKTGCSCAEKSSVDWCGCSPLVIRNVSRFLFYHTDILNSSITRRPRFFARKFDSAVALSAINFAESSLHKRIHNISLNIPLSWDNFWLNFYHYKFDDLDSKKSLGKPLKYITAAVIMPYLFPNHEDELEAVQVRADHFFTHDNYSSDVITLSLMKEEPPAHEHEKPLQQEIALIQAKVRRREEKRKERGDFYDPNVFTGIGGVTTKFDSKENVSRSYNNWVSQFDRSVTLYAPFNQHYFQQHSKTPNQTQFFFSVYLSQMSSEEDPPTYEQQHRAWKNSVMMKQEFQIQFNANCSKQEWLFEVFDPADKMVLKVQFMVFGDKARRNSVESHFALDDFCVISHLPEHRHLLPRLVNCEQKEWSLFYPDPKSAFMQDRHVML
ncbi:xylosyltransferase sqv-6-like isoform X2 [Convolutriloba macropyga]|uniref:xylosyltransferase sqv-6-like isoform X2 n=1 Tax=Convolutriloba macropyga TaxID=536237 RepID=UPI003F51C2E8